MNNLFEKAEEALHESELDHKFYLVKHLERDWQLGRLSKDETCPANTIPTPGRPALPELVQPKELVQRNIGTPEGHGALVHAIAHIEYNAVNLALDNVYRFRGLPDAYYSDWLQVASEEAYHFSLLNRHLHTLGYDYGDFPAHNGLWEMSCKTEHDLVVRMALVPRLLEARGLDVTPGIMKKFESIGDKRANEILEIIYRDEKGHVLIGSRWFNYACEQRDLDPEETFKSLIDQYARSQVKKPIGRKAREESGFTENEIDYLFQLVGETKGAQKGTNIK